MCEAFWAVMDSGSGCVTLAHFAEGRGVAVTCDVQKGDVLFTVPLSKLWSKENACAGAALQALSAALSEKEAIIADLMLAEEQKVALLPTLEEHLFRSYIFLCCCHDQWALYVCMHVCMYVCM